MAVRDITGLAKKGKKTPPAKKVGRSRGTSKVNPDVDAAMRGKGGERPSAAPDTTADSDYRAKKMDKGMPLHKMKDKRKHKSGRMSQGIPKGYDY